MKENHPSIVAAATRMFARYGFAKTTMSDIASEAGVARQTVYNAFPGKEEILRAVVRQAGSETYAAVMDAWAEAKTIDAKLSAFHDLCPLKWYEAIRAAPDWAALVDGMHAAASEEISALDQQWHAAFTKMLGDHVPKNMATAPSTAEIVDFFYSASLNAKHGVADVPQLRQRLATIKAATLALIG